MIDAAETFNGTWPFEPKFCHINGFSQHYVDEGEKDKDVLICLHGEPTWGYLYRKMIRPLSKHYRVIVPDHMGFGKSETPRNREYSLQAHVENLTALIEDLNLRNITFIGQDWGGPITGAYSLCFPENVKRICLLNTLLGYGGRPPINNRSPWFEWIAFHEKNGTLESILGELGSTILSVMKIMGFENSAAVDATWIKAYSGAFPNRDSCVGGINFPLDMHYGRMKNYIRDILAKKTLCKIKEKPAMLVEGMRDRAIHPENAIADFSSIWPKGAITMHENAGHFCQEDIPDTLIALIHQFIQLNP